MLYSDFLNISRFPGLNNQMGGNFPLRWGRKKIPSKKCHRANEPCLKGPAGLGYQTCEQYAKNAHGVLECLSRFKDLCVIYAATQLRFQIINLTLEKSQKHTKRPSGPLVKRTLDFPPFSKTFRFPSQNRQMGGNFPLKS